MSYENDNVVDLANQSLEKSFELFRQDLCIWGFEKTIVKMLGNRFIISNGNLSKCYFGKDLSREDFREFTTKVATFCDKNNIDFRV